MRRLILGVFTFIFALSSVPVNAAQVSSLSDQQIEIIRANCATSQVILQQLQQSDVATRISRGRDYEQLLKLMAIFNSRVVLNKLEATELTTTTGDFERQFRAFQRDYVTYSDQLSRTISMRCSEQPVTFYDALSEVRQDRQTLAEEVARMDVLLDRYQGHLDALGSKVAAGAAQ